MKTAPKLVLMLLALATSFYAQAGRRVRTTSHKNSDARRKIMGMHHPSSVSSEESTTSSREEKAPKPLGFTRAIKMFNRYRRIEREDERHDRLLIKSAKKLLAQRARKQ